MEMIIRGKHNVNYSSQRNITRSSSITTGRGGEAEPCARTCFADIPFPDLLTLAPCCSLSEGEPSADCPRGLAACPPAYQTSYLKVIITHFQDITALLLIFSHLDPCCSACPCRPCSAQAASLAAYRLRSSYQAPFASCPPSCWGLGRPCY